MRGLSRLTVAASVVLPIAVALTLALGSVPSVASVADADLVVPESPMARPSVGQTVMDPEFGTAITRLTGAGDEDSFETPIYSQLQAFSTDEAYVLLDSPDGFVVRRLADGAGLAVDTRAWNAPRWDPRREHSVLHYDANDNDVLVLQRTDVLTGATSDVLRFPERFRTVLNSQSFDEVSRDGRWLAGMATTVSGQDTVFAVDLSVPRLASEFTIRSLYSGPCSPDPQWGEVEPDWVGVSPLGRYLVVQWTRDGTARCSGLETFDLAGGAFVGRVYDGHQHGDLGVDADGTSEFFMTFELYHPSGRPAIGLRALPGEVTVSTPRFLQLLSWGNGEHISCQGPDGACLVTASGDASNGYTAFENELFLQRTNGTVERLAHHRSSGCGYFTQARATWSRSGAYAIFASDWGRGDGTSCDGGERSDAYLLTLRAGAGPPGAVPGPTTGDVTPPGSDSDPLPVGRAPTDDETPPGSATDPPSGAAPVPRAPRPSARQHLLRTVPHHVTVGGHRRLAARTTEGTAIRWRSRPHRVCRVTRDRTLLARDRGLCVLRGTAAAGPGLRRWEATFRVRVRRAQ